MKRLKNTTISTLFHDKSGTSFPPSVYIEIDEDRLSLYLDTTMQTWITAGTLIFNDGVTDFPAGIETYDRLSNASRGTFFRNTNNFFSSEEAQTAIEEGRDFFGKNIDRFGFISSAETTYSFNDANYTFTLSLTGIKADYYRDGVYCRFTTNKSIQIGNPPSDGTYFIYIDSTDGTLTSSTTPWSLDIGSTIVFVAIVFWRGTATPKYQIMDERHACLFDRRVHKYLHESRSAQLISGADIANYVLPSGSPSSNSDNTYSITAGVLADEDIYHNLTSLSDPDGSTPAYTVLYRTSSSAWTWTSDLTVPYKNAVSGNIYYDNAGTLTQLTNGYHVNTYQLATNMDGQARWAILHGQNQYLTADQAYNEKVTSFGIMGLDLRECRFVWQLTWKCDTTYTTTGKCKLIRAIKINTSILDIIMPPPITPGPSRYAIGCGFDGNANTGRWLEYNSNVASNISPLIIPRSCYLQEISFSCNTNATVTASIFRNGVSIATISLTASQRNAVSGLNQIVAPLDEISIQITSGSCRKPSVFAFFEVI